VNSLLFISVVLSVLLFIFADQSMSIFIHGDTEQYRDMIVWTARLYCVIMPFYAISRLSSQIMQVLKKSRMSARINLVSVAGRIVILLVPVVLGITGYDEISIAIAAGYLFDAIIKIVFTIYYQRTMDFDNIVSQ